MTSSKKIPSRYILSHSADPDGVIAAAFLLEEARNCEVEPELVLIDHPDVSATFKRFSSIEDCVISIADLTPSGNRVSEGVIDALASRNEVYLFDHHPLTPPERLEQVRRQFRLVKFPPDNKKGELSSICAAMLVLDYLAKKRSPIHNFAARVAQALDYRGTMPKEVERLSDQLNLAIRPESGFKLETIVDLIAVDCWQKDGYLTGDVYYAYKKAEGLMREAPELTRGSRSYHDLYGCRVVCAFAPSILYMKGGTNVIRTDERLRAQKGEITADILIVFYEGANGAVILDHVHDENPPDEKKVPLLPLCRQRGGGGRQNSGGFNYSTPTTTDNYVARREEVLAELDRLFSSTKGS